MSYASTGNYFKVVFFKCKHTFCIFRIFVLAPAKRFKHKRKDKFVKMTFHHIKTHEYKLCFKEYLPFRVYCVLNEAR